MYSDQKKLLKFAFLYLFGDISAEIWIKQKLHNTSRPSCRETKSFAKKHFLKKNLQSWHSLVTSRSTSLSAVNCQLHCWLPLLVKLSCSTPSYQNNFIRLCICISLIERENSMAAFIIQKVLYELFPEFQWISFMEITKQVTGTWTKNFWNNRYMWMKFELLGFLMHLK